MNRKLQIALIIFSGLVLIGASIFFMQNLGGLVQGSLLNNPLEEDIKKVASPVTYETRLTKGDALVVAGYFNLALTEYQFAIELAPENPEAHLRLGKAYFGMEDYGSAVESYQDASALNPSDLQIQVLLGHALIRNKNFQEAQALFDGFTKEVQEAQFYGALLDFYNGRWEEGKKKIKKTREIPGQIPSEKIQILENALKTFEDQQEGQNLYLETLVAKAMLDLEEYALAEGMALDVLSLKSDYRDAWIILGYSKLKMKAYADAEDAFLQAKKLDGIKAETHYFLGLAHYLQEEYDEAIQSFELALLYHFDPEVEAYHKIAESQLFLQRYLDALATYEHLVKIDTSSVDLYVRPVWIAITQTHELDRAQSLAQEAVSRFPKEAMSYNLLAWVYLEKGALEEAEKILQEAFLLNPNLAEAHYNAGLLKEKQGDFESAKASYKKANELAVAGTSISALASEKYNALIQSHPSP